MEERRKITEKSSEKIRFDKKLWTEIKDYVLKIYQSFGIKITLYESEEIFDDFDRAYDYICKYADDIKTISVHSEKDDERLKIVLNNRGKKPTLFIEAECPNPYRAHDVRQLMIKLTKDFNVNYYSIYTIPVFMVIALFKLIIDYFADILSMEAWHFSLLQSLLANMIVNWTRYGF